MSEARYPVELTAPDITRWQHGNTGVDYIHRFDSGVPGPAVMVNAVTHGNEICGAIVVDRLLDAASRGHLQPRQGSLYLSFANVAAYQRFSPADPYATRFVDEDFNRVWSDVRLDGAERSIELERARAMRPVIEKIDLLFDIHSMLEPSPPVMICGPLDKGIRFSQDLGIPEWIVSDKGHANGVRMRDYGGFGQPKSAKNALLVECGQHWERASETIGWVSTWRFLLCAGVVDAAAAAQALGATPFTMPASTRVVKVTEAVIAETEEFRFARPFSGMEVLPNAGELIATDHGREIRAPYDQCVLVMPVPHNVRKGLTAVRLGQLT
jgi:predicted deacylase